MQNPRLTDYQKAVNLTIQYHATDLFCNVVDKMENPDEPFIMGFSLIHIATDANFKEGVEYLLKKGSNPNLIAPNQQSPLHIAANRNHFALCETLIQKGANVSLETAQGETPLLGAVFNNSLEAATVLLSNGANPNIKYNTEQYPLLCAALATQNLNMLHLLVKSGANVNATGGFGQTPLQVAAGYGFIQGLTTLLNNYNADINAQDKNGNTALQIASICGQTNSVLNLLHYGADILIQNKEGKTALDLAIENKNSLIFQFLLEACRCPDNMHTDKFNKTLLTAAKENDKEAIIFLTDFFNNINHQDGDGNTALHLACQNQSLECIEVLIHYQADIHIQNKEGKTPLDILKSKNADSLIQFAKNKYQEIQSIKKPRKNHIHNSNLSQESRQKD